jgi:tRNA pseudouridine38-40 synthase
MPRFRLLIEYAGTRYSGWQIQKNARTVQGEIDRAVRQAFKPREFELYGAGRTDAGVHALAQVAHLELYSGVSPEVLRRRLNDELPADIHIISAATVPHRFHARHDAVSRSYLYQISRRRSAFGKPVVWWVREPLDVDRMRQEMWSQFAPDTTLPAAPRRPKKRHILDDEDHNA